MDSNEQIITETLYPSDFDETFNLLSQPVVKPDEKTSGEEEKVEKTEKIEKIEGNEEGTSTDESEEGQEEKTSVEAEESPYKILSETLKEKGLFSEFSEDELKEMDLSKEDTFYNIWDKKQEKIKENAYRQISEELPDEGKRLISFLRNGGKVEDFTDVYGFDVNNLDPIENSEDVVRTYYKTFSPDMEDADVEDIITNLKDTGKLENNSEKFHKKLVDLQTKQRNELVQNQEKAYQETLKQRDATIKNIGEMIDKSDNFSNIPVAKDKKQEFKDFIFKASIKLPDGSKVTPYAHKKMQEGKDYSNFLRDAYLAFIDYKFEPMVEKKTETKVTKKVHERLKNALNIPKSSKTGEELEGKQDNKVWDQIANLYS